MHLQVNECVFGRLRRSKAVWTEHCWKAWTFFKLYGLPSGIILYKSALLATSCITYTYADLLMRNRTVLYMHSMSYFPFSLWTSGVDL